VGLKLRGFESDGSSMPKPTLVARFKMGPDGALRTASPGKHKHFKIRLTVEGLPEGVQTVSYLLHPSFRDDRVLTIPYGVPDFREDIMSYGDFFVTVTAEGERPQSREWFAEAFVSKLSDALKAGHPSAGRSEEVDAAIKQIARL
jgi:hypothetical protein